MKRREAHEYRRKIEHAAQTQTDADALESIELFPLWRVGETYANGYRVRYNGKLWKYVSPAESVAIEAWNPADAPSLWAEVLPGQDGTEVGEWAQPDSTNPYHFGDRVMHNGKLWESAFAGDNVWEPGVYGWTEVTA